MIDVPDPKMRLASVERHERDSSRQLGEVVRSHDSSGGVVVATPTSAQDTAATLRGLGLDVTADAVTPHVLAVGAGAPAWVVHTHAPAGLTDYVADLAHYPNAVAATVMSAPADFARLRADADDDPARRGQIDAMQGYTEWSGCRAQALAGYLRGDAADECGTCDNCTNPPAGRVGASDARHAVDAVVQTGERFGTKHLISVLRGERTETVEGHEHDRLATWNSGAELTRAQWDAIYRQLVAIGALSINEDGGLVATGLSESVRSGEREIRFVRQLELPEAPMPKRRGVAATKSTTPRAPRTPRAPAVKKPPSARATEEAKRGLYRWRASYAAELGVPAIRILTDPDISRLIVRRPATMDELRRIVTPSRCDAYGDAILAALSQL